MRITKETHAPAQSTIFPPETTAPSTEQGEETGTALALIGTQPAALIYAPGVLAGQVERIKSEVRNELATLDVSRPKDKARIISLAAKVASAKVSLDDAGKTLGEEARKQLDAINADRKEMRDELDPFKIEVRKPVTDLENAEKNRIARHEDALVALRNLSMFNVPPTIGDIELAITVAKACNEVAERAIKEREDAAALAAKQAAERKAEEQARIAREAEEAEQRRIENERIQAEARAKQAEAERIAAEQRGARELQEAEDRRKREAEQAEARRIADAEEAKRREEKAIEAERQRVAAEKRRELEEAEKRAKNRAHLAAINREVMADLVALGASEEFGKVLIEGIVKGGVRHTTIAY